MANKPENETRNRCKEWDRYFRLPLDHFVLGTTFATILVFNPHLTLKALRARGVGEIRRGYKDFFKNNLHILR